MRIHFKHPAALLAAICLVLALGTTSRAGDFTILASELPPIKIADNGRVRGLAVDVLQRIADESGVRLTPDDYHTVSWSEAYTRTLETPNTVCLAMAKIPQRSKLFKWVGPIYTTKLGLIGPTDRDIRIDSVEQAAGFTIATIIDSAPERLLLRRGFRETDLVRRARLEQALELLDRGQVDLLAFAKTPAFHAMLRKQIDPTRYAMLFELDSVRLCVAFNKATDDRVIRSMQDALDRIKARSPDGQSDYERIVGRYFAPGM